jgi:hypothetical protein
MLLATCVACKILRLKEEWSLLFKAPSVVTPNLNYFNYITPKTPPDRFLEPQIT